MDDTSSEQGARLQARMTNSTRMPIAILLMLVAFAALAMTTSGFEPATGTKPTPITRITLGPYLLETYGNTIKHQDRLRHSKSYYKAIIRSSLSPDSSALYTLKITDIAELVRCSNLTLEWPEMEPLIECRPLQSYVHSDGIQVPVDQSNRNVMYAYRQSILMRHRSALAREDRSGLVRAFAYDLRQSEVIKRIRASRRGEDKFTEQDSEGFYIEATSGPLKCSLNLLLAINSTGLEPPVEEASDDQGEKLISQMFEYLFNGLSLSVEDFKFADATSLLPIELRGNLKLVHQHDFPYLTVKHTMFTHPISELFNFESEVKQTRDETKPNSERYNTTVSIDSRSTLTEKLTFKLEQVFVNEDLHTGWEEMSLVQSQMAAYVRGNWTIDSLVKDFLLYYGTGHNATGGKPTIALSYANEPANNDMVTLTLRISRSLLENLSLDSRQSINNNPGQDSSGQRSQHEEL